MNKEKNGIATRLRQTRANMLGTDDEEHYWDCHDAAAEIDKLEAEKARLQAAITALSCTNCTPQQHTTPGEGSEQNQWTFQMPLYGAVSGTAGSPVVHTSWAGPVPYTEFIKTMKRATGVAEAVSAAAATSTTFPQISGKSRQQAEADAEAEAEDEALEYVCIEGRVASADDRRVLTNLLERLRKQRDTQ